MHTLPQAVQCAAVVVEGGEVTRLTLYHRATYNVLVYDKVRECVRFNHDLRQFERGAQAWPLADVEAVATRPQLGIPLAHAPRWYLMDDVYLNRTERAA